MKRTSTLRYGVAVVAVIAATLIHALLAPDHIGPVPFASFYAAILLAAWYGRFFPGLLAIALGGASAAVFFHAFGTPMRVILYVIVGLLTVAVVESLQRARERAEASARLAEERGKELELARAEMERRVVERTAELANSRAHLEDAQRLAHVGNWEWDIATGAMDCSGEMHRMVGLATFVAKRTVDDFLGCIHPEDRDTLRAAIQSAVKARGSFEQEHRIIRPDGEVRVIHLRGQVVAGETGEAVRLFGTSQDITERKQVENKFRGLLEAAPDSMVIVDTDGQITLVNSKTEQMFGYSREELIGKPVEVLMPDRFRTIHAGHRRFYAAAPRARAMGAGLELFGRRKDGSEFAAEVALSPVDTGSEMLITAAIRDITERKRVEEHIRALNAELEQRVAGRTAELRRSNEELQQFAYIASHDLQEPLRTVSGFTQLLARRYEHNLDEDADEFIRFIVDATGRMHKLISALLEYSRAGSGEPGREMTDCNQVLEEALTNLHAAVEESGAQIEHGTMPVLSARPNQLIRVFQNLISNAIKYCDQPPPQIHLSAERCHDAWCFEVADNGPGIDPRHADRIFLPFRRLQNEQPGTGVGLAIAKKIVQRHGGRIWVEPNQPRGSIFRFTVPDRESESV